jgi:poly-gamma-glutamate synthesis protein (capsule biosynthesis protein)
MSAPAAADSRTFPYRLTSIVSLCIVLLFSCNPGAGDAKAQMPWADPATVPETIPESITAEIPKTIPSAIPETIPADTPVKPEKNYTVLACGDILLARTPGKRAAQNGYRYLFENVRELVSKADVAFANLESPVAYLGAPYPGKPPNVTFRADPETLFGVAWAGFDVLSLANNHMNDYGPRALSETLDFVDLLGIARCGAGLDLEEASRPALVERDGVTFAFLGYAEPGWSVTAAEISSAARLMTRVEERLHGPMPNPSTQPNPDAPSSAKTGVAQAILAEVVSDIKRVNAELKPDYLFVSVHWGYEHQHIPNAFQVRLGRAAIDAGATAVLGHHPHVFQSIERYHGGLIVYSLGNFVFDMAADHTYETAALNIVLSGGLLRRVDIIPLSIQRGTYAPSIAEKPASMTRLADIQRWSKSFGTVIDASTSTGTIQF